jgi:hypothetical protein
LSAPLHTDADNAAFIEVFDGIFANIGDIPRDLFGTKPGIRDSISYFSM